MLSKAKGFTLIELLVVVSIISLLSSIVFASLNSARSKARDAKRSEDMHQVQLALEFYYDQYGGYPGGDGDGLGGWDVGNQTLPFLNGILGSFMPKAPVDPSATGNFNGYRYYKYPAGYSSCPVSKGAFYVLEADMESAHQSPGWSCGVQTWGTAGNTTNWVDGRFENP